MMQLYCFVFRIKVLPNEIELEARSEYKDIALNLARSHIPIPEKPVPI
jgi:hypothetical protein